MSDTKFTPGPWLREGCTVYTLEHYGWDKGKEVMSNRFSAHVQGYFRAPQEELEANARLIAAAPDLLRVLRAVHGRLMQPQFLEDHAGMITVIGEAIELAEGRV